MPRHRSFPLAPSAPFPYQVLLRRTSNPPTDAIWIAHPSSADATNARRLDNCQINVSHSEHDTLPVEALPWTSLCRIRMLLLISIISPIFVCSFISRSVLDLPLALSAFPFLISHRTPNDAASLSTLRPLSRVNYHTFSPFFTATGFPFLTTPRGSRFPIR